MDPLKVKLTYWEAKELGKYILVASYKAREPQAKDELIVLSEFMLSIEQQLITNGRRNRDNFYLYKVPVSVARILHRRWQQEAIAGSLLQNVLSALDYGLTQRNLKPDPVLPTIPFPLLPPAHTSCSQLEQ